MPDNSRLDDELAAFTDQLLAGEDAHVPPEIEDLARVVRHLRDVIQPDGKPSSAFRAQLEQHLDQEWVQVQSEQQRASQETRRQTGRTGSSTFPVLRGWRQNRTVRLATLAATLAVILVGVLLVADSDSSSQAGSASGALDWPVIVGIAGAAFLGLLLFWLSQRGKS